MYSSMKKSKYIITSFLFVACTTPKLTNLHKGAYKVEDLPNPNEIITVNVNVIPLTPPKKLVTDRAKYFFDLNDSTQNKYLDVIKGMVDNNTDSLLKVLKKPLYEPKKTAKQLQTDFIKIRTRFNLSNLKHYHMKDSLQKYSNFIHPNTRLAWLNSTIKLEEGSQLEISTIDRLETVYESVILGSIERTQDVSFNAKLTGQYGINSEVSQGSSTSRAIGPGASTTSVTNVYDADGNLIDSITTEQSDSQSSSRDVNSGNKTGVSAGAGAEVGYGNSETLKEAFNLAYNDFKTGFSFDKESISISQKGRMFADISDNVIVTATMRPKSPFIKISKVDNFSVLFEKNGKPKAADKITVAGRTIQYLPCTLLYGEEKVSNKLSFSYNGLLRTALNHPRKTNRLEYDDKVVYYPFSYTQPEKSAKDIEINLLEYCQKVYEVYATFKGDGDKYQLKISNPGTMNVTILEDDDPWPLFKWIKDMAMNADETQLSTSKFSLFFVNTKSGKRLDFVNTKLDEGTIAKLKTLVDIEFKEL